MRRSSTNAALRRKLPTLWRVPDDLWPLIRDVLPPEKPAGTPGRPCVPFRRVLDGILYVLRSGCHWKAVPSEFGSGSTVHRRFRQWNRRGLFHEVVRLVLAWYDRTRGIDWTWQAADAKMAPAPLGGTQTGPNPTDRGKSGTKRHLLIDGRGVPLAFHLTGANRHDIKGLRPLLGAGRLTERPEPTAGAPQHLCLDKAYAAASTDELLDGMGLIGHVKQKGEASEPGVGEPVDPARRWKAERSISWLNNLRKLRVRWEKKAENYEALWLLGAMLVTYRRIVLG
jgi:putative transposase